jgi:hypothetical protein
MSKSPHSELLGVQCRKVLVAKISERANAVGISKSKFASLILEKWLAEGAKPVSPADSALVAIGGFYPPAKKAQTINKTDSDEKTP